MAKRVGPYAGDGRDVTGGSDSQLAGYFPRSWHPAAGVCRIPDMLETPLTRFLKNQTITQLRGIDSDYRRDIDAARELLTRLESERETVKAVIAEKAGEKRRSPDVAEKAAGREKGGGRRNGDSGTSLRESILATLTARPGRWDRAELFADLQSRGLAPSGKNPRNTFNNRVGEMVRRGEIEQHGKGGLSLPGTAEPYPSLYEEEVPAV